jgi:TPP-dependent indolepyruvate ferredoxin oxidoreductase alpha subunit
MLASDPKAQQEKRQKIQTWVSHKMTELRRYKRALSSSIEAWKEFQQTDIEYFEDIEHLLSRSIETTGKAFSDLKEALRKAEAMREELAQDYPQGVSGRI